MSRSAEWKHRLGPLAFGAGVRAAELSEAMPAAGDEPAGPGIAPGADSPATGAALRFVDELRRIARELRDGPASISLLNLAASDIDGLGRRLHGIGFVRDQEIAGCLSAAVRGLGEAREIPEPGRATAIDRAVHQLEAAADLAGAGVQALPPA